MWFFLRPWLLAAHLIYSFLPTGWGIRCVQCSSLNNPLCVTGMVDPTPCMTFNPEALYCVRYIGKLDYGRIVYRDCSRKDMGNSCIHKLDGKNVTIRVCVTTCTTDGCNQDSAVAPEFPASGQTRTYSDIKWTFLLILMASLLIIF